MQKSTFQSNTQFVFIASKFFNSPLGVMYGLLAFILCKNFNATPFQIAVLVSSKPLVAIISFYSILAIKNRPHNLKPLIIISTLIGFAPCLLFPFFDSTWLFIFSFAIFMMSARATLPAWTEIFKLNILTEERGKIFSRGSTVNYLANICIPLLIAPLMDFYPSSWKWIFFMFACLQSGLVVLLCRLEINHEESIAALGSNPPEKNMSLQSILLGPWKNSWVLLKQRPDFRCYQIAFLFGGAGLILVQPVLPIFFEQVLQLSYTQLAFAISLCKGVGFTLTSPLWARWFNRVSIHLFNFYVTAFAGLFAIILVLMGRQIEWIYIAYFIYGVMQAGSELSWHLSGPRFSQEQDSTLFTSVNVAMVGLRGCVVPFLGEIIYLYTGSLTVFLCSAALCLTGSFYSLLLDLKSRKSEQLFEMQ